MKQKLIKMYKKKAEHIKAYREIYQINGSDAIINKQNFHISYPNIDDRIPDDISTTERAKVEILTTSGSTSGQPSNIPVFERDILYLENYYMNLGKISNGVIPHDYRYINMFPISGSTTGRMSELIVPEEFRLGRTNTDPKATAELLHKNKNLGVPIIIAGLPILHLTLLDYLKDNNETVLLDFIKRNVICLSGGESPTIEEKLRLMSEYKDIVSVYGSTESGPRLGFSTDANLIIDIALTIDEFLKDLGINATHNKPLSFFYDKYLHEFEVISEQSNDNLEDNSYGIESYQNNQNNQNNKNNKKVFVQGKLVNTPLIQQCELKIRWDQDDYSQLVNPNELINLLRKHSMTINSKLCDYDNQYGLHLNEMFAELIGSDTKFKNLLKYFGMLLLFGRNGIIYGGANLDNKFVELVCNQLKNGSHGPQINSIAIHRSDKSDKFDQSTGRPSQRSQISFSDQINQLNGLNDDTYDAASTTAVKSIRSVNIYGGNQEGINTNNYSGLRLDILVEVNDKFNKSDIPSIKKEIIRLMKQQHHDFEAILDYYEHNNAIVEVEKNIVLWFYNEGRGPISHRYKQTHKRNYILKKVDKNQLNEFVAKY